MAGTPSLWQRAKIAARVLAYRKPVRSGKRSFAGAMHGRLTSDWLTASTSADAEIRGNIRVLIDRARSLERDNGYVRGFLQDCETNVVGAVRNDLTMRCGEFVKKNGEMVWQPDKVANRMIQEAWAEWCKVGTCTVDGRRSWLDVRKLAARSTARDGNFIARWVRSENRFGYALQILEVDHLDLSLFKDDLPGGGKIRFGVETNDVDRVVAYHLRVTHPGDRGGSGRVERISAASVYHVAIGDRAEQTLGVPWIVTAINQLRQLGAFEEAAVVAARVGALQTGFFKKTPDAGGAIGEWLGEVDQDGAAIMDSQPATFTELPQGWDVASWNPEYPNTEYASFRKGVLMGVASGLGTSYITLGNDLEAVNYSSARLGIGEEREMWKGVQLFYVEHLYERVFTDWLQAAILNGALNLPITKLWKFNRPRFRGRHWPYIDPVKERTAQMLGLQMGVTSRSRIAEEAGEDLETIIEENKADMEKAESAGVPFGALSTAPSSGKPVSTPPPDEE